MGVTFPRSGDLVRIIWNSLPFLDQRSAMASPGRGSGVRQTKERDEEATKLRQLVQTLRGDLNMLSNEARRKYPAVREVW